MDLRTVSLVRELARDGEASLVVRGTCMEPHMPGGERVRVRSRSFYVPGDVIVFRTSAGDLAAHRLLGWRPAGLVTKGDGCDLHDAPVRRDRVVGTATVPVTLADRARAIGELARIVVRRLAG